MTVTPHQRIMAECRTRGHEQFVRDCCRMLDGDDSDAGLVLALGGDGGRELLDRGLPENQRYWLRVWAARGLFWAWDDEALPFLTEAADDDQWRVREWAAKVAGKHELPSTLPWIRPLVNDQNARVRAAAGRACAVLEALA